MTPYNYVDNEPINAIDPNGLYKLSPSIRSNIRLLSVFIMIKFFAYHEQKVKNAFANLNTKVSDFAENGKGPAVIFEGTAHGGRYPGWKDPLYSTDVILINKKLIGKLNNAKTIREIKYWSEVIVRTIIHETAHWAWLTKKMGFSREKGTGDGDGPMEPTEQGNLIEEKIWDGTQYMYPADFDSYFSKYGEKSWWKKWFKRKFGNGKSPKEKYDEMNKNNNKDD